MIGLVPRPTVPAYISPSAVIAFEQCPAKAGFRLDPALAALRRTGPAAAVGGIAHEVLAARESGAAFGDVWHAAAERWHSRLVDEWAPATPPRPEQWQNWALTRERVRIQYESTVAPREHVVAVTDDVRHAWREREIATDSGHELPIKPVAMPGPLPWVERKLYDARNGLMGIPDLVEDVAGSVVVVDHKTGLAQPVVTSEVELQVRLYAALARAYLGRAPSRLEVRDGTGHGTEVAGGPALVEDAVHRAVAAREALAAAGRGEQELVGRPGAERCMGCPFRGVCRAYLNASEPVRTRGRAFAFEVLEVDADGPTTGVRANVVAPSDIAGETRITGFPFPNGVQEGSLWGAAGFELLRGHARGHWTTLIHRLR